MSELDQVPFGGVDFAENPEPRCPCLLLLDTSTSMSGLKIKELNSGLQTFADELRSDAMAAKRVEVAMVTFGPVQTIQHFVTADAFQAPTLVAAGATPMGSAIESAVALLAERKATYRQNGISYYRPWMFLITDGAPTDDVTSATAAIREGESPRLLCSMPSVSRVLTWVDWRPSRCVSRSSFAACPFGSCSCGYPTHWAACLVPSRATLSHSRTQRRRAGGPLRVESSGVEIRLCSSHGHVSPSGRSFLPGPPGLRRAARRGVRSRHGGWGRLGGDGRSRC